MQKRITAATSEATTTAMVETPGLRPGRPGDLHQLGRRRRWTARACFGWNAGADDQRPRRAAIAHQRWRPCQSTPSMSSGSRQPNRAQSSAEDVLQEERQDDAGDQIEDDHQPLRVHPRAVGLLAGFDAVAMMPHELACAKRQGPPVPSVPGVPLSKNWQARRDSNPQHAVLETAALPLELLA